MRTSQICDWSADSTPLVSNRVRSRIFFLEQKLATIASRSRPPRSSLLQADEGHP